MRPYQAAGKGGARPHGIPVGIALDLGAAPHLMAVLQAIGSVHGDGDLPKIPVQMVTDVPFSAAYRITEEGEPVAILLNGKSRRQEWALAHEIGHFIDQQTLSARGTFGSLNGEDLDVWRSTVDSSAAVQNLMHILDDGGITVRDDGIDRRVPADARFLELQITYQELWARSYAQYIAVRSADAVLMRQLGALLAVTAEHGTPYTLQWEPKDFTPIMEAIDQILAMKGWRQ